jgi:hypothetical protein
MAYASIIDNTFIFIDRCGGVGVVILHAIQGFLSFSSCAARSSSLADLQIDRRGDVGSVINLQ